MTGDLLFKLLLLTGAMFALGAIVKSCERDLHHYAHMMCLMNDNIPDKQLCHQMWPLKR